MGLLSKLLIDRGVNRAASLLERTAAPIDMSGQEWEMLQQYLGRGNREVADHLLADDHTANWEWGGQASPFGKTQTVTSNQPSELTIPRGSPDMPDLSVVYHSHPSQIRNGDGNSIVGAHLSSADLMGRARGISAFDRDGGYSLAIHHPNAPRITPELWQEISSSSAAAADPHLPGHTWSVHGVKESESAKRWPTFLPEEALATQRGLANAMSNTGMLEQYQMIPGTMKAALTEQELVPGVAAATDAAESIIRRWLKAHGYSGGTVNALIASLSASGGLAAAAQHIGDQQQEA